MDYDLFMVFDVESIGLHGEGFAVGWQVIHRDGTQRAAGTFACDPVMANGRSDDRAWVAEHVPPIIANCKTPADVRTAFWRSWSYAHAQGAVLAADVAWPVEARFLRDCIADDPERVAQQPYPLIDIASVLLAAGRDPLGVFERRADEARVHHPQDDARQSARLLIESLNGRRHVAGN